MLQHIIFDIAVYIFSMLQYMFFNVTLRNFAMLQYLYFDVAPHSFFICLRCCTWSVSCSWDRMEVRGMVDAILFCSIPIRFLFALRGQTSLGRGAASGHISRTRCPGTRITMGYIQNCSINWRDKNLWYGKKSLIQSTRRIISTAETWPNSSQTSTNATSTKNKWTLVASWNTPHGHVLLGGYQLINWKFESME
jgi:hypothetical protein